MFTYPYRDAFLVNAIFFFIRFYEDHVFMSINPPNGLELSNLADTATHCGHFKMLTVILC
jgi:hypothetical protein